MSLLICFLCVGVLRLDERDPSPQDGGEQDQQRSGEGQKQEKETEVYHTLICVNVYACFSFICKSIGY